MQACGKYFAVPLWANIQEGLTLLANSDEKRHLSKTVQIVEMAKRTAQAMSTEAYLVLDLLWKPVKGMLRFILIESSHGRIILMTSDLNLDPVTAIQLYCRRVTIETMFDTLKNTLGAMAYHFWSQYLSRASRRPKKKKDQEQNSTNPTRTNNTLAAIEKFVNIQLLVLGMLQLIAKQFPTEVKTKANCWLRTVSSNTPSEFVTRTALANILKNNLYGFAKDWITQLIRRKQKERKGNGSNNKAA